MKIIELDIESIKPYKSNPRKIPKSAVDKVTNSIGAFGWKQPIVVDKNNFIIAGHTRLLAAKKLKMKTVPVLIADDLDDADVKAYRIADNRTNQDAAWDFDFLKTEFEDLNNFDFDLSLTGFDEDEINNLFDDENEDIEKDEVPPLVENPISIEGDIWILGNHKLMCADSTNVDSVKKLMNGELVNMVFTDPPYGIDVVKNKKVGADFGIAKKGEYSDIVGDNTIKTAEEFYHTCISIGFKKFIIFGGNYFIEFLPFSDGWLIWDKRGDSGIRNTFADGEMAWCSFHTPIRIYTQLWNGMIREGEKEKRLHPTQKPIKILSHIIDDFTKTDEIVYDGFGGSGSILIACETINRKCRMIEISPKYCDVIIKRWQNLTGKYAIHAETKKKFNNN